MEAGIHFCVTGLIAFADAALLQDGVAVLQASAHLTQEILGCALLADAADRVPLENPAQIDGIDNVCRRERTHDEAPRLMFGQALPGLTGATPVEPEFW